MSDLARLLVPRVRDVERRRVLGSRVEKDRGGDPPRVKTMGEG